MAPPVWYYFHMFIKDENFHVSGGSPVGVPGVLNGRSSNVRFGFTLSLSDQGDLFVMESNNPTAGDTEYKHNGGAKAYTIYNEEIEVYGQSSPEKMTVRVAPDYGPDVSQVLELADPSSTQRICAHLEALQDDSQTLGVVLKMNTPDIKTVADVQTQFQKVLSPGLGAVYSDELGGIGTTITGRHRTRASGHTGRLPVPGNGTFDYTGLVPTASVPSKINTDNTTTSYVWAANSRPFPTGHSHTLSRDYMTERARVLDGAMSTATATELSSIDFHKRLLNNQSSGFWLFVVGTETNALQLTDTTSTRGAAFEAKLSGAGKDRWNNVMKKWDGIARMGSTEATDLWRWVWLLAQNTEELLTVKKSTFMKSDVVLSYVQGMLGNPTARQRAQCGGKLGEAAPHNDNLVCVRYAAVVWNSVVADYGRSGWAAASDAADKIYVQHPMLHGSIAQGLFSRTMAKGGDPTSLDITKIMSGSSSTNPDGHLFVGANGPSGRWIFNQEFDSNNGAFLFNVPAGNSGNVFSDFYYNIEGDFSAQPLARYRAVFHYTNPKSEIVDAQLTQTLGE